MADSKPVKQEVDGTVILPPFVFPAVTYHEIGVKRYTPVLHGHNKKQHLYFLKLVYTRLYWKQATA